MHAIVEITDIGTGQAIGLALAIPFLCAARAGETTPAERAADEQAACDAKIGPARIISDILLKTRVI